MTDRPPPSSGPEPTPDPASDDALAAYLAGDLDDATAAAVERRLDDPDVAARLDGLADVVGRLRRVDDVTPPAGYEQRLDARLRDARPTAAPAAAAVSSLDEARARRSWTAVGATAAVLVVLAVGSLAVLQGFGSGADEAPVALEAAGGDTAMEAAPFSADEGGSVDGSADGAEPGMPEAAAPPPPAVEEGTGDGEETTGDAPPAGQDAGGQAGGGQDDAGQGGAEGDTGAAGAVPPAEQALVSGPVVVDDTSVPLPTDADVAAQLGALPELSAALGLPVDEARRRAVEGERALARAPTVGGSAVDGCLQTSLADYEPRLLVRVQAVFYAGRPATALVVASSDGGQVVDRGTAVIVEPATCEVYATVPLTS